MAFSNSTVVQAWDRQAGRCGLCGSKIASGPDEDVYDAHHVQPRWAGGADTLSNCVILHKGCHVEAHNGSFNGKIVLEKSEFRYGCF